MFIYQFTLSIWLLFNRTDMSLPGGMLRFNMFEFGPWKNKKVSYCLGG